ncbi:MAG: hypothetical protein SGJ20_17250 [Planctomycetota bacterium]|nr:hypothetical protein [Planctomycetota bacterium]
MKNRPDEVIRELEHASDFGIYRSWCQFMQSDRIAELQVRQ